MLLLIAALASAQRNKRISIAFLNTGTAYPFAQFSQLATHMQHPGVEAGYSFNLRAKSKHDWYQEYKLAYFYHRYVQHAILLYTDIGYRYKISHGLTAQLALGAGYLQAIPATAKLKLQANGEYKNGKGLGRMQGMATANIGVGYTVYPPRKTPVTIFTTYQQLLQMPFVKAYVPILPYNSLLIGFGIPLQSNKKIKS